VTRIAKTEGVRNLMKLHHNYSDSVILLT